MVMLLTLTGELAAGLERPVLTIRDGRPVKRMTGPGDTLYASDLVQRDHDVGLRSAAHDEIDWILRLAGFACDC
jgi:hypothetical protein